MEVSGNGKTVAGRNIIRNDDVDQSSRTSTVKGKTVVVDGDMYIAGGKIKKEKKPKKK